ncbi:response regulator transcription factor [Mariprofundus erugo]|nr:response regulator transcription factor [Mariprofundus erugo]
MMKVRSTHADLPECRQAQILVVDDDDIIRTYLDAILSGNGYMVSLASDFETVRELLDRQNFDLIIADLLFLERNYSGLDIIQHVTENHPECKAIVMTSHPSTHTAIAALRLSAVDYLCKPATQQEILDAVSKAFADSGKESARSSLANPDTTLSKREMEMLDLLFRGFSFNQIALKMHCSLPTVKTFSQRTYKKLGVKTRAAAIHEAIKRGIIPPAGTDADNQPTGGQDVQSS